MTYTFVACEITNVGVSILVDRGADQHRSCLGVGDFKDRAAYIEAVSYFLESHMNAKLADLVANCAADKCYGKAAIDATQAEAKAAIAAAQDECAAVQANCDATVKAALADAESARADADMLGTKEEAAGMRKAQEIASLKAQIDANNEKLAVLLK